MFDEVWDDVETVIRYSQDYYEGMSLDLTELRTKWEQNKREIIEAFGGQLMLESPEPVIFRLGPSDKEHEVLEFCQWIERRYHNTDLADFIWQERSTFFDNKVEYPDLLRHINAGMKITKAFRYFENNKEILEAIRNEASRVIQKDRVNGTLVFSVHPLDYLSISENTYNWRSCHALDGDYKLGNLNYMADKYTIVCYIRDNAGAAHKLPNFPGCIPWNSKKWRVLLYWDNNNITVASRQYPFEANSAFYTIDKILHQAWNATNFQLAPGEWRTDHQDLMSRYIFNSQKTAQYNDVLSSTLYRNIWHKPFESTTQFPIYIGEPIKCLHCGKDQPAGSDTFLCFDCELTYGVADRDDIFVCDCCNRRRPIEEVYQTQDGSFICEECMEEETTNCADCGTLVFWDDAIYSSKRKVSFCPNCAIYINDLEEED